MAAGHQAPNDSFRLLVSMQLRIFLQALFSTCLEPVVESHGQCLSEEGTFFHFHNGQGPIALVASYFRKEVQLYSPKSLTIHGIRFHRSLSAKPLSLPAAPFFSRCQDGIALPATQKVWRKCHLTGAACGRNRLRDLDGHP